MIDKRRLALLAIILLGTVVGGGLLIGAPQADNDPAQMLVDVAEEAARRVGADGG